jgi:hypothetical protein
MVYRIRYQQPGRGEQATETVEANSPAEAIVKFNVTRARTARLAEENLITSVCAEEPGMTSQW